MMAVDLALGAPWVGIVPGSERPGTLHAVTQEALLGMLTSDVMVTPCGESGVLLVSIPVGSHTPVPWPPPHRLPESLVRCRACWLATGKKRPACEFVTKEDTRG